MEGDLGRRGSDAAEAVGGQKSTGGAARPVIGPNGVGRKGCLAEAPSAYTELRKRHARPHNMLRMPENRSPSLRDPWHPEVPRGYEGAMADRAMRHMHAILFG